MDDKIFDEQYEKAKRTAATAHAVEPRARHVHYNRESGLVVVSLQNGESFSFSPLAVEELVQGLPDELAQVEVSPSGDGLHWQRLNADIGVIALQQIALEQLYACIETAWLQQRDHQLVDQLADQYPQFKDELYDFFTLLIDSELDEPLPSSLAAPSIERTKHWLESEGFAQAKDAAQTTKQKSGSTSNPPATPCEESAANESNENADDDGADLMGLLMDHTGLAAEKIASDNDIPDVVMVYVEDHYDLTPVPVREEIIDRFSRRYGLDKNRLRRAASHGSRAEVKVAAFRKSPYPPGFQSFIERIEQSDLPMKVKEYWLGLAKKGIPDEKA